MNTWVGQKIAQGIKIDLFDKLMHYNAAYFDKKNSGDILYRFNKDVDTACSGLLANLKLFTTRLNDKYYADFVQLPYFIIAPSS